MILRSESPDGKLSEGKTFLEVYTEEFNQGSTDLACISIFNSVAILCILFDFYYLTKLRIDFNNFAKGMFELDLPEVDDSKFISGFKIYIFVMASTTQAVMAMFGYYSTNTFLVLYGEAGQQSSGAQALWFTGTWFTLGALYFHPVTFGSDGLIAFTFYGLKGAFEVWDRRIRRKFLSIQGPQDLVVVDQRVNSITRVGPHPAFGNGNIALL